MLFCILKEAIEKKEQRAKRFHFRAEVNLAQRNVALDRDMMKKGMSLSLQRSDLAHCLEDSVPHAQRDQILCCVPLGGKLAMLEYEPISRAVCVHNRLVLSISS